MGSLSLGIDQVRIKLLGQSDNIKIQISICFNYGSLLMPIRNTTKHFCRNLLKRLFLLFNETKAV